MSYRRPSVWTHSILPIVAVALATGFVGRALGIHPATSLAVALVLYVAILLRFRAVLRRWYAADDVKVIQATPCARCGKAGARVVIRARRDGALATVRASIICEDCTEIGAEVSGPGEVGIQTVQAMAVSAARVKWTDPAHRRGWRLSEAGRDK